jgi:hypothetical protein
VSLSMAVFHVMIWLRLSTMGLLQALQIRLSLVNLLLLPYHIMASRTLYPLRVLPISIYLVHLWLFLLKHFL